MSDSIRKPHGNSVLKTLPEERQEAIISKLKTKGQTYAKVRQWLKDDGLVTSETALGDFWQWWHLQRRWEAATSRGKEIQELLQAAETPISPEQIEAVGQAVFLNEAIATGGRDGLEGFVSLSKLRLKQREFDADKRGFELKFAQKEKEIDQRERQIALDREKYEWDASDAALKKVAELKSIAADRSLNHDAKIARVRERLFGSAPTPTPEAKP